MHCIAGPVLEPIGDVLGGGSLLGTGLCYHTLAFARHKGKRYNALIVILESLKDHIQEPQVGQMEEYFRILFDRSKNVRLTSSAPVTDI